ncbi:unnamed protein product [Heligmosomoides polygyrus]|uniref:Secreted protein n=1 Tax=Heligmosomoides polygyrus TaxID=6339 RepID=A0A183FZT6_HELPZ|nr:unnamed protein product [Heligmosomoides polygyrus]
MLAAGAGAAAGDGDLDGRGWDVRRRQDEGACTSESGAARSTCANAIDRLPFMAIDRCSPRQQLAPHPHPSPAGKLALAHCTSIVRKRDVATCSRSATGHGVL